MVFEKLHNHDRQHHAQHGLHGIGDHAGTPYGQARLRSRFLSGLVVSRDGMRWARAVPWEGRARSGAGFHWRSALSASSSASTLWPPSCGELRFEVVILAGGSQLVEGLGGGFFLGDGLLETVELGEGVIGVAHAGHGFGHFALRGGGVLARDQRGGGALALFDLALELGRPAASASRWRPWRIRRRSAWRRPADRIRPSWREPSWRGLRCRRRAPGRRGPSTPATGARTSDTRRPGEL